MCTEKMLCCIICFVTNGWEKYLRRISYWLCFKKKKRKKVKREQDIKSIIMKFNLIENWYPFDWKFLHLKQSFTTKRFKKHKQDLVVLSHWTFFNILTKSFSRIQWEKASKSYAKHFATYFFLININVKIITFAVTFAQTWTNYFTYLGEIKK